MIQGHSNKLWSQWMKIIQIVTCLALGIDVKNKSPCGVQTLGYFGTISLKVKVTLRSRSKCGHMN